MSRAIISQVLSIFSLSIPKESKLLGFQHLHYFSFGNYPVSSQCLLYFLNL